MKKFLVCLFGFLLIFSCTGCKKNKTNLSTICENLTTYTLDIDFDTTSKKAQIYESVNYVNNTNCILKQIKFHLYPQFFKEGCTNYIISNTKLNQVYPNGLNYAQFEIDRVQLDEKEIVPTFEGEKNNILCVNLDNSLVPNANIIINIYFTILTIIDCFF